MTAKVVTMKLNETEMMKLKLKFLRANLLEFLETENRYLKPQPRIRQNAQMDNMKQLFTKNAIKMGFDAGGSLL